MWLKYVVRVLCPKKGENKVQRQDAVDFQLIYREAPILSTFMFSQLRYQLSLSHFFRQCCRVLKIGPLQLVGHRGEEGWDVPEKTNTTILNEVTSLFVLSQSVHCASVSRCFPIQRLTAKDLSHSSLYTQGTLFPFSFRKSMSTRAKRTCEGRADIFSLCESEGGARARARSTIFKVNMLITFNVKG